MVLVKANYYAKPEGTDCFNKIVATNTYAGIAGLTWATFDVLMLARTKGYLPTLARFAYNVGPAMGMASAFTLTTYALTNIRGKDDRINYFLGGMAAGGILGGWKRNHILGLVMGVAFGIAGVVKKTSKIEGWEFFPDNAHHEYRGVWNNDYTVIHERPKNYIAGKQN